MHKTHAIRGQLHFNRDQAIMVFATGLVVQDSLSEEGGLSWYIADKMLPSAPA